MSNRGVVVLLIVALSLAGMVLLFERQISQETAPSPDEYKVFKAYSKDQVDSVSLVDGELAVRVEGNAEGWQMSSPVVAAADENRVEKLLGQLGELMEVEAPIKPAAGEKVNLANYGLANPSRRIIVSYGGVAEAALSLGLRTGKHNQLYARLGEENRVIIINAEVTKLLDEIAADENFYRSRKIFQAKHIDKALEIQVLAVERQGPTAIVLRKDQASGLWELKSPIEDRADQESLAKLLDECAALRVVEFIKSTDRGELANRLKEYGLVGQEARPIIGLTAEGMQSVLLHLGRADKEGKYRYGLIEKSAVLAVSQEVVKIPADFIEVLPRSADELRDKKFLRFEEAQISEVRLDGPSGTVVLARVKSDNDEGQTALGKWLIKLDEGQREIAADERIVSGFLGGLQALSAKGFAGAAQADTRATQQASQSSMGFDDPYLRIELKTDQQAKKFSLEVGALTDGGENRYARLADDKSVRKVTDSQVGELVHDGLYFYERVLVKVNRGEITSCEMSAADQELRQAILKEGQWWLAKPTNIRADNEVVRDAIGIFDPLRAQEIVADDEVQTLADYGLDEPGNSLTAVTKKESSSEEANEQEYVLLVGKSVGEKAEQYYGRLKGRELIFTIAKEAVDKLSLDWRSKKVLPLVSWQINQLSKVEIAKRDKVLLLERPRENWQVVSPKEFWPDQEAVKKMLGSLLELEAGEFGQDPSDKQYGLERPTMVVSLTLDEVGSGKQQIYKFSVGGLLEGKGLAVKTQDEDAVRLVPAEKLELLEQSYLRLRRKDMLSFDSKEVRAIEILTGGKKRSRAERANGSWKLTAPAGAGLELAKLEAILEVMSNLRASEIVADTLDEAKKYGLTKPALTVTVELEDEELSQSLLIGAQVEEEKKEVEQARPRYALLAGDSTVFVLSGENVQVLEKGLVFKQEH